MIVMIIVVAVAQQLPMILLFTWYSDRLSEWRSTALAAMNL